jgi:hypothetical protein
LLSLYIDRLAELSADAVQPPSPLVERRVRVRGEEYRLSLNPQHGHALLSLARKQALS